MKYEHNQMLRNSLFMYDILSPSDFIFYPNIKDIVVFIVVINRQQTYCLSL